MSQRISSNVGIVSIAVCGYCIALLAIRLFNKHEASKIVMSISNISLLLMSLSCICICVTYYKPYLWSNNICYCHPLWMSALILYILSIYLLKAMYVTRIYILSKGSILGMYIHRFSDKISKFHHIFMISTMYRDEKD